MSVGSRVPARRLLPPPFWKLPELSGAGLCPPRPLSQGGPALWVVPAWLSALLVGAQEPRQAHPLLGVIARDPHVHLTLVCWVVGSCGHHPCLQLSPVLPASVCWRFAPASTEPSSGPHGPVPRTVVPGLGGAGLSSRLGLCPLGASPGWALSSFRGGAGRPRWRGVELSGASGFWGAGR